MSVTDPVSSDRQIVRLLQMGIVLEEVVEARASKHYESLTSREDYEPDPAIQALLEEAGTESAEHRERLEALIDELGAETVAFDRIQTLVEERYSQPDPDAFDDILYDQLHGEESAYKFYDDLIAAIEASDAAFSIDRDRLLDTLEAIREEEAEGVREVTALMSEER